jgi:hypothetical protein
MSDRIVTVNLSALPIDDLRRADRALAEIDRPAMELAEIDRLRPLLLMDLCAGLRAEIESRTTPRRTAIFTLIQGYLEELNKYTSVQFPPNAGDAELGRVWPVLRQAVKVLRQAHSIREAPKPQ